MAFRRKSRKRSKSTKKRAKNVSRGTRGRAKRVRRVAPFRRSVRSGIGASHAALRPRSQVVGKKTMAVPKMSRGEKIQTKGDLVKYLDAKTPHIWGPDSPYIPSVLSSKHYYVSFDQQYQYNPVAGPGIQLFQVFRMCSVNDPDFTGVGSAQPTGHDRYASDYTRCIVTQVDYKVTFVNYWMTSIVDNTEGDELYCVLNFNSSATIGGDIDSVIEFKEKNFASGRSQWLNIEKMAKPVAINQSSAGADAEQFIKPSFKTFRGSFFPGKFPKLSATDSYNTNFRHGTNQARQCITNANANHEIYLQLGVGHDTAFADDASDNVVAATVELTYHVTWWDPTSSTDWMTN